MDRQNGGKYQGNAFTVNVLAEKLRQQPEVKGWKIKEAEGAWPMDRVATRKQIAKLLPHAADGGEVNAHRQDVLHARQRQHCSRKHCLVQAPCAWEVANMRKVAGRGF